jgi:choline kinase
MTLVNGRSLIRGILESCVANGVDRAVLVTGYRASMLERHVRALRLPIALTFVCNHDYRTTNNLYSLWMARRYLKDGGLLFEADLVFDPALVARLVGSPHEDLMVVDRFRPPMNGTVIARDSSGKVTGMYLGRDQKGMTLSRYHKTVNIYRFSAGYCRTWLVPGLEQHVRAGDLNSYYECVIQESIRDGAAMYALPTGTLKWWEIDTPEDVKVAEGMFAV